MIQEEQVEGIKKQLLSQIEGSEMENKEQITNYIKELDAEQLEEFLKKNKIDLNENSPKGTPKCIFCSIINNETPSYKIAENKNAIAILEINPLSRAHVLILPKEHTTIDKIPRLALSLAQKIAKKIKQKIKPEDIKIETSSLQEHAMINVIPFYRDQKIEKRKATKEELEEIQALLQIKARKKREKKQKQTSGVEIIKLPKIHFRIP